MSHLHTEPGYHDFTVGIYILRLDGAEPRALLHLHKKMHMLFPIGGHIELDETPWQAVAREIAEESGYVITQTKVLQPRQRLTHLSDVTIHPQPVTISDHDVTGEHFHTDLAYALIVTDNPQGQPDEGEATDLRWLTRQEIFDLPDVEIFPNTREIYTYIFDECLPTWEAVSSDHYKL